MARKIRSTELETRGERLNTLTVRKRPYTVRVAKGIRLGYRRTELAGSWVVLKSRGASLTPWTKKFATADDYEESNGSTILSYWEACDMARKLARGEDGTGGETEGGAPLTVAAAIDAYEADLIDRDGRPANAKWLRFHLSGSINAKPVALLTKKEVRALRKRLLDQGLARATANRWMKAFAAAMNLAAGDDKRITNRDAWTLAALPDAMTARNIILNDAQVRAAVAACYVLGGEQFGIYIELLAVLGPRPSQARRLAVRDLEFDPVEGPRVQMPSAKKGKRKKFVEHTALKISHALAAKLKTLAGNRAPGAPLLVGADGKAWGANSHARRFKKAAVAVKLPAGTTAYSLRHSSIVRALLKNVPVRLVAAAHNTSVGEIERTYSKYIANPGADLLRNAQLDLAVPTAVPTSNAA